MVSRLEALYMTAIDLPAPERAILITDLERSDASLARELIALLSLDETGTVFEPLVRLVAPEGPIHAAEDPLLAPGTRVGRWTIVGLVGVGASGEVYEVSSDRPPRSAALKLLHTAAPRGRQRERFEREAEVLGMLDHPGIVPVHDFNVAEGGPAHGMPYMVMGLVRGKRLDQWAQEAALEPDVVVRKVAEACDAVHYANLRGVVHRDLKPSNIMIDEEGRVRIIDFGVARLETSDGNTSTLATGHGRFIGTPAYMAPEQLELTSRKIDLRVDVYGLGAVLYALLTGSVPHAEPAADLTELIRRKRSGPPRAAHTLRPGVSRQLGEVIAGALEPDASERYGSSEAFAADLRRTLAGMAPLRNPPSRARRGWLFARRNPVLTLLGAGAVVSLVVGSGVALWQREVAVRSAGVAQQRFDELRVFTHWVIFDLNDQLAELPGTTGMRAQLVERATGTLASMDPAPDDDALAVELAEAHLRLFRVTGSHYDANVWDVPLSNLNIRRAVELLEPRLSRLDAEGRLVYADAANDLAIGNELSEAEAFAEQHRLLENAYAVADSLRGRPGSRADLIATLSLTWLGRLAANEGDNATALAFARRVLTELENKCDDQRSNADTAAAYGVAWYWLGYVLFDERDSGCVEWLDRALGRFDQLIADGSSRWKSDQRWAAAGAARSHLLFGEVAEAIERARATMIRNDDDMARDPGDATGARRAEVIRSWIAETVLEVLTAPDADFSAIDRAALLSLGRSTIEEAIELNRVRRSRGWIRLGDEGYLGEAERIRAALYELHE